ncbi:MAG: helix-turn-helix domain-containing protein [Gaiellaceae bacterium]
MNEHQAVDANDVDSRPLYVPEEWARPNSVAATWQRKIMRDRTLTAKATLVGCVIADYMDASGTCFPSLETITGNAGCSKSSSQRAIAELESKGYLRVRRGRPNRYSALLPDRSSPSDHSGHDYVDHPKVVILTSEVEQRVASLQREATGKEELRSSHSETNEERAGLGAVAPAVSDSDPHRVSAPVGRTGDVAKSTGPSLAEFLGDDRPPVAPSGDGVFTLAPAPVGDDLEDIDDVANWGTPVDRETPTEFDWAAEKAAVLAARDEYVTRARAEGWSDEVEGPREENTMSPRELPRCASKTPLAERSEPDWTAYREAMNEAWDHVKAAGRLDEPGLWDRIRGEISRRFGVDE